MEFSLRAEMTLSVSGFFVKIFYNLICSLMVDSMMPGAFDA